MGCADGASKLTDCRNKLKRCGSTAAPDHYAVMGVAITASSSDVKQVSSSLSSPLALVPPPLPCVWLLQWQPPWTWSDQSMIHHLSCTDRMLECVGVYRLFVPSTAQLWLPC
jgi:hypothetical protein